MFRSFVEVKKQQARCKARLPDSRENDVVERSESELDGSRYFINVELSEDENNLLSETDDDPSDLGFQINMGLAVNEYNEADICRVNLSPDGSDVQNENPLKCPQCERTYSRRSALLQHLQTHSSHLPFQCIYCHKSFKTKAFKKRRKLQDHLLSHGTERNYSCHVCGKAFKIASTLAVHMKAHQDLRPYQCQQCGMAFKFKEHIRLHTGEKPFKCEQYGESFRQKQALKDHLKRHESVQFFERTRVDAEHSLASPSEQRLSSDKSDNHAVLKLNSVNSGLSHTDPQEYVTLSTAV
ncbi:unnamed protein product [Clavelina lepadiformis]|uniref:C2H2-type domain-containing protein n=1 Tax=Clavelina lepadiformis TaxID=159417 RepID=A0ABP0GJ89_CLALP